MNAKMNLRVPRKMGNLLSNSVIVILFGEVLLDGRVIPSIQDLSITSLYNTCN